MSGTSADAIDAALVAFDPAPRLVHALAAAYPRAVRDQVLALSQAPQTRLTLDEVALLDHAIGAAFADVACAALDRAREQGLEVRAIGSHGQTLRHCPRGTPAFTLQLGDANLIAERTGVTTVADFRRRDLAAGGEGAPLLPAFHAMCLASPDEPRAVLNLGGIANLTLLAPGAPVIGFDTGPANALLDAWSAHHGAGPHDAGGAFAASGASDPELLARMLRDPFFERRPPKSSGRDHFHLAWIEGQLADLRLAPADVQATLVELTARSVADALMREAPATRRVIACGGGVHNPVLMAAIRRAIAPLELDSSVTYGVDADFLEAMAFAWLARETLAGRPGNLPSVTGATGPRVLGAIYPA